MKHDYFLVSIIAVAVLALLAGAFLFPTTKEVVKEVPVVKEVVKEVPKEVVKEVVKEVEVNSFDKWVASAFEEYKKELKDNTSCGGEEYDFEQLSFKNRNNVAIVYNASDEDDVTTKVSFEQKLKFLDTDTNEKCYRTDNVEVVFHSDKDIETEVSIS